MILIVSFADSIAAELKKYANKQGECFPSYARLGRAFIGSFPSELTQSSSPILSYPVLFTTTVLFRTVLCGFNQIGCFLTNHNGGRVRISRGDRWHD